MMPPGRAAAAAAEGRDQAERGGGKMASDMLRVVVKNTGAIKKSNGVRGGRDQVDTAA